LLAMCAAARTLPTPHFYMDGVVALLARSFLPQLLFSIAAHSSVASDIIFVGLAYRCEGEVTEAWLASWWQALGGPHAVPVLKKMEYGGYVIAMWVITGYLPPLVGMPSFFVPIFVTAALVIVYVWVFSPWWGLLVLVLLGCPLCCAMNRVVWGVTCNYLLKDDLTMALWCEMTLFQHILERFQATVGTQYDLRNFTLGLGDLGDTSEAARTLLKDLRTSDELRNLWPTLAHVGRESPHLDHRSTSIGPL